MITLLFAISSVIAVVINPGFYDELSKVDKKLNFKSDPINRGGIYPDDAQAGEYGLTAEEAKAWIDEARSADHRRKPTKFIKNPLKATQMHQDDEQSVSEEQKAEKRRDKDALNFLILHQTIIELKKLKRDSPIKSLFKIRELEAQIEKFRRKGYEIETPRYRIPTLKEKYGISSRKE